MSDHRFQRRASLRLFVFFFSACLSFMISPALFAAPAEKDSPPPKKKDPETKKSPSPRPAPTPPKRTTPKKTPLLPQLPPQKRPKDNKLWGKLVDKIGTLVPKGMKKGWSKTKRKWSQTVAVYEAMRKLLREGDKDREQRMKIEKKRLSKERWQSKDEDIEKRIQQQLSFSVYKQSCLAGSALSCLRWAQKRPTETEPWRALRNIWMRRQQWEKLLPICERLSLLPDSDLEDQLCHARSLTALKQAPKALQIYQKLLKKHPKHGHIWLAMGQLYLQKNELKAAQSACRQASKQMPAEPLAWQCLGDALRKTDRNAALRVYYTACKLELASACRAVLALRPTGISGLLWWSTTVARISARGISQGTLSQSCRLGLQSACESLARQHRLKAERLKSYKRQDQADWWFRRATQIAPQNAKNWRALGLFLFERKQWKQSCYALHQSLQKNDQQPKLWNVLGQCHQQLAQFTLKESTNAYKKACALGQHDACKRINFNKK